MVEPARWVAGIPDLRVVDRCVGGGAVPPEQLPILEILRDGQAAVSAYRDLRPLERRVVDPAEQAVPVVAGRRYRELVDVVTFEQRRAKRRVGLALARA